MLIDGAYLTKHRRAAGNPEQAFAQVGIGLAHSANGVGNDLRQLFARFCWILHGTPDDLYAFLFQILRDRLCLSLYRADIFTIDKHGEILQFRPQLLYI